MKPIETTAATGPDLRFYARLALNYWSGILGIFLLCALLFFAWTLTQPRIYSASASALVLATESEDGNAALAGDNLAKSKAVSYKSIAGNRMVADRVITELELDEDSDSLLSRIKASVQTNTAEIRVTASAERAEDARVLADAWVVALAAQVKELEAVANGGASESAGVILQPLGRALLPTEPVSPNTPLIVALGGGLGLVLGVGYALVRSRIDRRVRSAEALEGIGVSVVGTIPQLKRLVGHRAVVETGPLNIGDRGEYAFAESLRELRTNLNYIDVDNPPRIIVMTSSVPGEGKSSLVANLAVTMALAGKNVVLIDADLRRPVQTKLFDLMGGAGLTDVLSRSVEIEDVLQPYGPIPNLQVMGAGRIPPNPSELLGSKAMELLLQELAINAVVLVDTPPLLPATDAAVLSNVADGVLVAVRAGHTTSEEVGKALHILRMVDARIFGAILNQVPTKGSGAAQFGYYGKYYYSSSEEVTPPSSDPAGEGSPRGLA